MHLEEWSNKIGAAGTPRSVYSPTGQKLALMNGSTVVRAFILLPGGGSAVYASGTTGPLFYRHSDWLGSSRLATTQSRTKYFDVSFAPFGENYKDSGTADYNFTGQNQDTIAQYYDFLFREYSQVQGRWLSPDPARLAAVNPANPQSWNRYAYVTNRPASLVDPLGLYQAPCQIIQDQCPDPGGLGGSPPNPGPPTNDPITHPDPVNPGGDGPGGGGGDSARPCLAGAGPLAPGQSCCGANDQNANSVTSQCLAEYNGSTAARGVQFFSLFHLVTDFRNAWAEWTFFRRASMEWLKQQFG